MTNETFTLKPTEEFIELNKVLKLKQVAQTGGHAKILIEDGLVKVNGEKESRIRRKLRPGDVVETEGTTIAISKA